MRSIRPVMSLERRERRPSISRGRDARRDSPGLRRPSPEPRSVPGNPADYDKDSDSSDEWRRRRQHTDAYIAVVRPRGRQITARPPLSWQEAESVYGTADTHR